VLIRPLGRDSFWNNETVPLDVPLNGGVNLGTAFGVTAPLEFGSLKCPKIGAI